jgi:hypothetical protein
VIAPRDLAVSGPVLFARYAYGPNSLGYCGPDQSAELFGEATRGFNDQPLRQLATRFEGAYPYLALIARANGIADPLDARVVDAYWLGNELLTAVRPRALADSMEARFRKRLDPTEWRWLEQKGSDGALPMHAFHVFDVFPRLGLLRSGSTDGTMDVMNSCRIRWGKVLERSGDHLVVTTNRLELVDGQLRLAPVAAETVRGWIDGAGLIGPRDAVRPGDNVSIHWDWACEVLDASRLRALRYWTCRELGIANRTI